MWKTKMMEVIENQAFKMTVKPQQLPKLLPPTWRS